MMPSSQAAAANPASAGQKLREVRRGVAEAPDAHLLEVVRVLDALERRGEADAVLAPVRERLRTIHPTRPLRFSRLLFLPADPLIVAPVQWRPGSPTIPRQALMPLANGVRAIMAATCSASRDALACVDAEIAGATTADTIIVHDAGIHLWTLAASALHRLANAPDLAEAKICQAEWRALGLPAGELALMAQGLAAILAAAEFLHEDAARMLADEQAVHLLGQAHERGPHAGAMLRCLLLLRAPHTTAALLAAPVAAGHRAATHDAAALALDHIDRELAGAPCLVTPETLAEMQRQADLLDALAELPGDADQRRRVAQARSLSLDVALQRLETGLQDQLLAPLNNLASTVEASDAVIGALEGASRQLRAFEQTARRLGNSARFDTLAAALPRALADAKALTAMDRARLLEILLGAEAALRSLEPAR